MMTTVSIAQRSVNLPAQAGRTSQCGRHSGSPAVHRARTLVSGWDAYRNAADVHSCLLLVLVHSVVNGSNASASRRTWCLAKQPRMPSTLQAVLGAISIFSSTRSATHVQPSERLTSYTPSRLHFALARPLSDPCLYWIHSSAPH